MTCKGNESSGTIFGSHECHFDKLENFAITYLYLKHHFSLSYYQLNATQNIYINYKKNNEL